MIVEVLIKLLGDQEELKTLVSLSLFQEVNKIVNLILNLFVIKEQVLVFCKLPFLQKPLHTITILSGQLHMLVLEVEMVIMVEVMVVMMTVSLADGSSLLF